MHHSPCSGVYKVASRCVCWAYATMLGREEGSVSILTASSTSQGRVTATGRPPTVDRETRRHHGVPRWSTYLHDAFAFLAAGGGSIFERRPGSRQDAKPR